MILKRLPRRPAVWASVGVLSLLCLFHIVTIRAACVTEDEGNFTGWVLHGLSYEFAVLPRAIIHDAYVGACLELWPLFRDLHRGMINTFGVDLAAVRAPSILGAVLSLVLFWVLAVRIDRGRLGAALAAVLALGFSEIFYFCTHVVRPESIVLFIHLLVLAWIWEKGGRLSGFMSGFLVAFGLAFHQATTLVLPATIVALLVRDGRSFWKQPRVVWWAIGAFAGLCVAMRLVDMDAGTRYLIVGRGHFYNPPPLFRFALNPGAMVFHLLTNWCGHWIPSNQGNLMIVGLGLSAAAIVLRRWGAMEAEERFTVAVLVSYFVALMFGGIDPKYVLFALPWFYLAIAMALRRLWRRGFSLDAADAGMTGAIAFWVLAVGSHEALYALLLPMLFWTLIRLRTAPRFVLGVTIVLALGVLQAPESVTFAWTMSAHLLRHRPFVWVLAVIYPLVVVALLRWWQRRTPHPAAMDRVVCLFAASLFVGVIANDGARVRGMIVAAQPSAQFRQFEARLATARPVIATAKLRYYVPQAGMSESHRLFRTDDPGYLEKVRRLRPALLLLDLDQVDACRLRRCGSPAQSCPGTVEELIKSPFGTLVSIRDVGR